MELLLEHAEGGQSVKAGLIEAPSFSTPWHHHREYEILLILESRGKRFAGDRISDFAPGDLVLIGPHLPHLYRNGPEHYEPGSRLKARCIAVQFPYDCAASALPGLPEASHIRNLLERAAHGVEFPAESRNQIAPALEDLLRLSGFERWLKLMEILHRMAESRELTPISEAGADAYQEKDHERLRQVFEFAMSRFREDIGLEQAAELAGMAPAAFSRYFKSRTRMTFSSFLLELKTGYAARLLTETGKSVAEICHESGFHNLSNFNRHFKSHYGLQPLQFRKQQGASAAI